MHANRSLDFNEGYKYQFQLFYILLWLKVRQVKEMLNLGVPKPRHRYQHRPQSSRFLSHLKPQSINNPAGFYHT